MIDIHAHFDREKDDAGSVMIHANQVFRIYALIWNLLSLTL
jgi:hypothetical protein